MQLPALVPALVAQRVADELLVYDPGTARAHRLNGVTAVVFSACQEGRIVGDAAARLEATMGLDDAERLVLAALRELSIAGLVPVVDEAASRPPLTRREALKIWGTAAVLPLVVSIAAPLPAFAQSLCVTDCVANCDGSNLCSPATPNPAPDALCASTFCGQQRVFDSAQGCDGDTFVSFGCFTGNGSTIQEDCCAARTAASIGGAGTPYACCRDCLVVCP